MPNTSVKARFLYTAVSSVIRAGLSLLGGIVIARGLGPDDYGSYIFLLGSFTAVRQLLDLGTGTAFYTFISRLPRSRRFYLGYAAWQATQFLVTLAVIGLVFPHQWIDVIWLGRSREIVLLAFAAIFMQQQVWLTVSQIAESQRLTHRIQRMNVGIAIVHLLVLMAAWKSGALSVPLLFGVIFAEYVIALGIGYKALPLRLAPAGSDTSLRRMIREYVDYCAPLLVYSAIGFLHTFAENWLFQRFAGPAQQAYYGIGLQFASISLLATTAIQQIFWKEIAEAQQRKDRDRVASLYAMVPRFTILMAAAICGLLVPWSREITVVVFGPAYAQAGPVLAVLLLHPIHNSLGIIIGTAYLATGNVRPLATMGLIYMVISIPVIYFVLAPNDLVIPGLGLGALGMALKLVISQILQHNAAAWWFARTNGIGFTWRYQVSGMLATLIAGYAAAAAANLFATQLLVRAVISASLYAAIIGLLLWQLPWIFGFTRTDLQRHVVDMMKSLR